MKRNKQRAALNVNLFISNSVYLDNIYFHIVVLSKIYSYISAFRLQTMKLSFSQNMNVSFFTKMIWAYDHKKLCYRHRAANEC